MPQIVQSWTPPSSTLTGASSYVTGTATTAGNTIVVLGNARDEGAALTVSDNAGNTYVPVGEPVSHGAGHTYVYVATNAASTTQVNSTLAVVANHVLLVTELEPTADVAAWLVEWESVSASGTPPVPLAPAVPITPVVEDGAVLTIYGGAVSNRSMAPSGAGFTPLPQVKVGQMSIVPAILTDAPLTPVDPGWQLTDGANPGGTVITIAIPPGDGPPPEPEELTFASATGGNPVGGTTLEVISDDSDDTVVWSGDNPDGEVWDPWTLPPIEPPAGDLTVPVRTTSTGGSGVIAFEISGDGATWAPGPTIVCDGAPASRPVVFPASALTGITEQQWATGVQVRLTLTAD